MADTAFTRMNPGHLAFCAGEEWAETVRQHIVPGALVGVDLGSHLLEVGPGPGATTDVLRQRVPRLTAVEVDPELAASLAARLVGTNVQVVEADATALPFEAGHFSSAICLTMLHHIPSLELQDCLFAEMARVVARGGHVVGSDNLDGADFRAFHKGDVCLPVDPSTLPQRLERAGLTNVVVETNPYAFRFVARAP